MKRYRYIVIAVGLIMLSALASCRQDLCYDHYPSADVTLTWEQEWERDYGRHHSATWVASFHGFEYSDISPALPEWVNFVKFYKDGTSEDNFMSVKGGNVRIDNENDGSYLLYNGDTEYIVFKDMASISEAHATTTSRSRTRNALQYLQSLAPDTRTANPPDILYVSYIDNIPSVAIHEKRSLPVKMQPLVYTYVIHYEFEYGREHVALARGAIGGMAESVYLRTGITSDKTAILLYDCNVTDYGFEAHVGSFGVPSFPDSFYGRTGDPDKSVPVVVNLELLLTNGKYLEFNYDVSDQIVNQPRGGVIYIKGIRVEDEQATGSGGTFDVDVSSWGDTIEDEIPL